MHYFSILLKGFHGDRRDLNIISQFPVIYNVTHLKLINSNRVSDCRPILKILFLNHRVLREELSCFFYKNKLIRLAKKICIRH